jgi:hypothetical protein
MAEREITVSLKLDPKGFEQGANVVESELQQIEKQAQKTDASIKEIGNETQGVDNFRNKLDEINQSVNSGELDFRQLRKTMQDYQSIALAAGRTSPIGQEALQQAAGLRDRLDDLDKEVKNLANDSVNLQASMQLGQGILAGYSAFQGVASLVGVENEKLQETFVKLQAAQSAMMGIEQLHNLTRKESALMLKIVGAATKGVTVDTNASVAAQIRQGIAAKAAAAGTALYTAAVGTSTGAMKAFRLAMISTGIGAIVVGIGLLVANWESFTKWIGKSATALGELAEYFLPIRAFVEWWTGKTYEQMEAEDAAMKKRREAQKEIDQQHKKRVEQIEKERDAVIEAQDKKLTELDREKQLKEAAGESSAEITLRILKEELIKAQAVFDATQGIIDSYVERYERIRQLRGQDMEEFKASMKAQGIDLNKLQEQANELQEKNRFNVELIENKITGFRKKQNEQRVKDKKDSFDKELEVEEIFFQESEDKWSEYSQRIKDANYISFDDLTDDDEFFDEMEIQMEETLGKFDEFVLAIGQAMRKGFDNIPEEMQEMLSKVQEGVEFGINAVMDINDTLNDISERRIENIQSRSDKELEILKGNTAEQLNNDKLSAHQRAKIEFESAKAEYEIKKKAAQEEDKIARRQFQRNKAIALTEIAINTAQAIVKGIAQFGPPPNPLSIAAIATAGSIGIAQAALVASKKFQGSAGSLTPPTFTPPNLDTGDIGNDTGNNTGGGGGDEITTDTDALLNQGPTVVISQVEINKTQNELSNIADISTL